MHGSPRIQILDPLHSANQMATTSGAYGYRKCPKSRSEPVEFGCQYRVQRLACRAVSASAEFLVDKTFKL